MFHSYIIATLNYQKIRLKPCQEVFLCQLKVMSLCWVDHGGRESPANFWGPWPCQMPTLCQAQLMFFIIFRHALKAGNSNDKYSDALGLCIWGDYQNGGIPNSEIGESPIFFQMVQCRWSIRQALILKSVQLLPLLPMETWIQQVRRMADGTPSRHRRLDADPTDPHVFLENSTQISSDIHYPWRICT